MSAVMSLELISRIVLSCFPFLRAEVLMLSVQGGSERIAAVKLEGPAMSLLSVGFACSSYLHAGRDV